MENSSFWEKMKLNSPYEESLREDNDTVLFYTGLTNWEIYTCLFNFVRNSSPEPKSSRGILNSFQKYLLGFSRMRLNLSERELGYMFRGISEATVSRTFLHVVNVMHHRL